MWKDLWHLLVAHTCYGCERPLVGGETHICFHCLGELEETGFFRRPAENELFLRLAGRVPLAGACGLYYFDKGGLLQRLIQQLKYHGAAPLGNGLGAILGHQLQQHDLLSGIEAIIPVPLHPAKMRKRGYNQAERIAMGIAKVTGIPCKTRHLARQKASISQTQLAGTQRWDNISAAFSWKGPMPGRLLLVDDVITTGATLEACIRAIMDGIRPGTPGPEILVASIGMARKNQ